MLGIKSSMSSRLVAIYAIKMNGSGRVIYVGQSSKPATRFLGHVCRTGKFHNLRGKISLSVLKWTTAQKANKTEERIISEFKNQGLCSMNGKQYCHYWARSEKHLPNGIGKFKPVVP